MSEGHAVLSPSGAEKWMTCAGSAAMETGIVDNGSEYSDEGTAAHALAAMCLEQDCMPEAFRGRILHIVNGVHDDRDTDLGPADTHRKFEVDDGMIEHVGTYVRNVRQYIGDGIAYFEQKVPIGHITGEEGAEGSADTVNITTDDELQVHDLKFGMGVQKFAKNNPQGMFYLLGAMNKYATVGPFKSYRFVIHQPRLNHLDEWSCTHDELMAFEKRARDRSQIAWHALKFRNTHGELHDKYLKPGQHCKDNFCKARATCPALAKFVEEAIGADFEALPAENVGKLVPTDLEQLGLKNSVVDIVMDWCKQVRGKLEAALFEHHNSPEAVAALGHKLVQGKKGNRAWSDEDEAEKMLKSFRLKNEQIHDYSLKSPPAIEKLAPKFGKDGELIADQPDTPIKPKQWLKLKALIKQAEGKPSVAPLDDKRPALVLTPTSDDFAPVTGAEDLA